MRVKKNIFVAITLLLITSVFAQTEANEEEKSNIQNYTPSKLLEKGKVDIKWFNNLYTQTRSESNGVKIDVPRSNFFTTSLEVFTGVSNNKKINAGLILEYRSNSFNGQKATSVFDFNNEAGKSRNGLSHFAPSIKIAPFNKWNNFSIQSSLFIPLLKEEINANGYLGNKSYIWQNRFFYDYTFSGKKFQLFTELGTRFFFGKKGEGYANNSLELAPGVFLSYFPTNKFTVLTFVQHAQLLDLGNNFEQNYSAAGFGAKYQLTKTLNLETLYSKFVRGNDTGLGQSFNLGLRAIF
ncbi:hypothetical protein [Flavobacterium sp. K5-23]|uniref:hypothetical protein n=1 Tax=Flavobacterium sp. K5-23 TaxID=2746225 RepID=UPI00200C306F|nr:hypothetical protein [Flavobacterium sp. K5-23]UQD57346.1 hypothetical protein FLAK523_13465 [Flavobacterium sp. K5-23]